MSLSLPVALAVSYLVGAFPTSYVAGRLVRGIDLRQHGSGNLGATNAWRVLGPAVAVPVGLVDIAKGALTVGLIAPLVAGAGGVGIALACGAAAVVGHVYSVFVGFRGGKGVATSAGVVLGIVPWALLAAAVVFAAVVAVSGYVSLGSVLAALALAPLAWLLHPEHRPLVPFLGLLALAIVWLHRANLRRLVAGTEHRFGRRAPREVR